MRSKQTQDADGRPQSTRRPAACAGSAEQQSSYVQVGTPRSDLRKVPLAACRPGASGGLVHAVTGQPSAGPCADLQGRKQTLPLWPSGDSFYLLPITGMRGNGHPSRRHWDLAHPFGSVGYAEEELRAEIASYTVGGQPGIDHDPGRHAAYVIGWVQILKEDPKAILRVTRDADKISNYMWVLEKQRLPANMEKLPQVERPAEPEKGEHQPAPRRLRAAGGRERRFDAAGAKE